MNNLIIELHGKQTLIGEKATLPDWIYWPALLIMALLLCFFLYNAFDSLYYLATNKFFSSLL